MSTRTVLDLLPSFMAEEIESTSRTMYDALRAIPADAAAQLGSLEREVKTLTKHCDSWYNKAKAATLKLADANKVIGTLEREIERLKGLETSARAAATMFLGGENAGANESASKSTAKTKATTKATTKTGKSPTETELMGKAAFKKQKPKARRKKAKKKGRARARSRKK